MNISKKSFPVQLGASRQKRHPFSTSGLVKPYYD